MKEVDSKDKQIKKAESSPRTAVPTTFEIGQPRIITSSKMIEDTKKKELTLDNRLNTFDCMMADPDVFSAVNYTTLFSIKSLSRGAAKGAAGSEKSKIAADYINYCLHNMGYSTWLDAVMDMCTALKYGWSDLEIVLEKRNYGKYKGNYCLYKLSPRSQHSVYGWLWNDNFTEWKGLVQKPPLEQKGKPLASNLENGINLLSVPKYYDKNYPIIESSKLLHTAHNSTLNNPQGDSPLMHCFDPWFEKMLIQNFELSGISKDLKGLPVLRVPSELVEMANNPTVYPEQAAEYLSLQKDMSDLHQGNTTHMVLTSDVDPASGKYLYDFELIGIQGGTTNYVTSDVIDQKRRAIYNTLGAGFLLLGQDGSGSYSLSTSQTSAHGHLVERDIMQYTNVINTQLIPRLLAANGVYLDYDEMPIFVPAEPDELSLDELSKAVQRMAAVKKLTPSIYKKMLGWSGLPTDGVEELDYTDRGESRSGDGMAAGMGNGTSQEVAGSDTSTSNLENGGVTKNLVTDKGTDRIIDVATGKCINEGDLDKYGSYK